ncbi:MAG: nucleotidyltransferase family protein [Pirellulaceae bacterium]
MEYLIGDEALLERMVRAVEKVRDRLRRSAAALENAGVPYAVVGGNAVAAWVATVDESAVRNTRDVDILIRRADLPAAKLALEAAGFIYRHVKGIDMFLDGPGTKARDAVHILFANEKVRPDDPVPVGDVEKTHVENNVRFLPLESLVRMKLIANRDKDRTHLRDMLELGLIDASWCQKLPPELAVRLQHLLDTPEG